MRSPPPLCAHELVGWLEEEPREKVTPPQHPPTPTTSFATYTALQWVWVRDAKGWGFWVGWGWESSAGEFGTCVWVPLRISFAPTHLSVPASDYEPDQEDAVRTIHVQNSPHITAGRLRVDCAFGNHIAVRVTSTRTPTTDLRRHCALYPRRWNHARCHLFNRLRARAQLHFRCTARRSSGNGSTCEKDIQQGQVCTRRSGPT